MSINLRNLLINQINTLDPSIDTSVGSNFRDLLINPLSLLLEGYQQDHDRILNNLSLRDPKLFSEEELDALAANFLVERRQGEYHTGKIRLYFLEPISMRIPSNSVFVHEASGVSYETTQENTITRSMMEGNVDANGRYYTPSINIRSTTQRNAGALSVNTQLTSQSFKQPRPVKVEVIEEVSGGYAKETNINFYNRILNSVRTQTIASENVIKENILSISPGISHVEVIGAGHPLMVRDLVTYNDLIDNVIEDFSLITADQVDDDGYAKGHQAFYATFPIEDITTSDRSAVTLPTTLNSWDKSFTTPDYKNIYKFSDSLVAEQDPYVLIEHTTWSTSDVALYNRNDGLRANNQLLEVDEIRAEGNFLILGKTPQVSDEVDVRISVNEIDQLVADVTSLEEKGYNEESKEIIQSIKGQVGDKTNPEVYGNFSPILHGDLEKHTGIQIDATMSTTDGSINGEISYLTVLRNTEIYMAHDGYGLGWRKQPDFLIRLNYDTYEDEDLRAGDIAKFTELFNVDPEAEGLVGGDVLRTGAGNDQYWFFNIYLVDNNILSEEVQMGTSKIFDSINGINQYLQRSKYWIEPETDYDFRVKIDKNLATKIWVKPSTSNDYDLKIDKGVTFPEYVPAAGETITSDNGAVQSLNATYGNFGIAVGNTRGYEWTIKEFSIKRVQEMVLSQLYKFKIDISKWPDSAFTIDYIGSGYDPNNSVEDEYSLYIFNSTAVPSRWDLIGTNSSSPAETLETKKISSEFPQISDYTDGSSNVYIAAVPSNLNAQEHFLQTSYISLSNPQAGKKALGNAIDIYCHDPDNIITTSQNLVVSGLGITLNDPYIQEISELREANSQIVLDPSDYNIHNNTIGEAYGNANEYNITFKNPADEGMEVTVIYNKWVGGTQVNAYLNDPENRYPAVSLKEKIMPPAIVYIDNLDYSGVLDEDNVIQELVTFINTFPNTTLSKSDIIGHLSGLDLTNISLDFTLKVKQCYSNFNYVTTEVESGIYTLPGSETTKFFTQTENITNILNV